VFKHILLPTDGSELSNAAIQKGIQFAKSVGAKVTGFYAIVPSRGLTISPGVITDTSEKYHPDEALEAENYLSAVDRAAKQAGVECDTTFVGASHAYDAIIKAAEERGCDCIVMASHGRHGFQGLLIGSETAKVLTHTKLPVLVFHG
jgi:nucleotide-binding universal stress UspA family protein